MVRAIHLDDQTLFVGKEINDVVSYDVLAQELDVQRALPQLSP